MIFQIEDKCRECLAGFLFIYFVGVYLSYIFPSYSTVLATKIGYFFIKYYNVLIGK